MKYKMLIIDDDQRIRKEIISVFSGQKDISFELMCEASNLEEATEHLQNNRFDVISIDMKLENDQDGLIAIRKANIFQQTNPSALKIVFTAYPTLQNCVKAMRYGAWDYIDKNDIFREYKDDKGFSIPSLQMLLRSVKEGLKHRFSQESGPNSNWLQEHLPELVDKYSGKIVAFIDEEVIGDADSKEELQSSIKEILTKKGKEPYYMWIPKSREVL